MRSAAGVDPHRCPRHDAVARVDDLHRRTSSRCRPASSPPSGRSRPRARGPRTSRSTRPTVDRGDRHPVERHARIRDVRPVDLDGLLATCGDHCRRGTREDRRDELDHVDEQLPRTSPSTGRTRRLPSSPPSRGSSPARRSSSTSVATPFTSGTVVSTTSLPDHRERDAARRDTRGGGDCRGGCHRFPHVHLARREGPGRGRRVLDGDGRGGAGHGRAGGQGDDDAHRRQRAAAAVRGGGRRVLTGTGPSVLLR